MEEAWMRVASKQTALQAAVKFVKKMKKAETVDVSSVEKKGSVWIVYGTRPIDLQGHPWTERFKVVVDSNGRVQSTDFSLL